MNGISTKSLNLLFIVFSIGNLLSLWVLNYFPSVDGPAHVSLVHAWINYDNPEIGVYREFYEKSSLNSPNLFIYASLYLLMTFFPPFVAEKILLSFLVVGLPYAVRYMTTSLDPRGGVVALLAFPITFNYITYFGFYNFLFGLIAYCLFIGYWIRRRGVLSSKNILAISIIMLGAYFVHLSSVIFITVTVMAILVGETIVVITSRRVTAPVPEKGGFTFLLQSFYVFLFSSIPVGFLMINYYATKLDL